METHNVIKIYDELYNPIKYGNENVPSEKPICHDCGVKFGSYHHNNCDMEECPKCGMQLISCDCDDVTYINMDLKELNKTKLQQYHHHIIKTKEENEGE